jgi:hypothetical protein
MYTELPQSFLDSVLLFKFLEVKAPDRIIKHNSLRDAESNIIDCNIYHPKYGTITVHNEFGSFNVSLGIYTYDKDVMIMSSYSHEYQCPTTRKRVVSPIDPLNVLCIYEDGSLTNKDNIPVFDLEMEHVQQNQTRQALDNKDFAEIYQREFLRSELADMSINHEVFKKLLSTHVQDLIKLHQNDRAYGSTLDFSSIVIATQFITWMSGFTMPPIVTSGISSKASPLPQASRLW